MTLRKKTLTIIAVTSVSLIAVLYVVSRVSLLSGYARLEEQNVHQNVERALSALSEEITVLDSMVFDWAAWDDTYSFVETRNPGYVRSNLIDETFLKIRLNLMLFVDAFGEKVFAKGFDLHNETEVPVPQAFLSDLLADDLLIGHHETESSVTGIVLLSEGPMLVASRPILTSKEEGPIRGALVMGRYLDSTEIERLAQVTHLSFTVQRFNDPFLPPDFQKARVALSEKETMLVRPTSDESIAGYVLLEDIYGEPALFLRVDMPREIYKQGKASIVVFTLLLLAASLTFGVVTMLLLERQVLRRLAHLGRSVSRIGVRGDLSARVAMGETDELSRVAGSVNEMLSELEQSEKALGQRARQLQVIGDVGRRVSAILNLDELLSCVVTAIQQSFSYSYVDIFLVDQGYATLMASSDPRVEERQEDLRFEVGKEGMIGWVTQSGEPLLANDVSQESHYLPDELLPETKSELTVPLKVEGRVVGVLDLQDNRLNAFSKEDIFVLETLGHQVAIAIENARLFRESQRRTEEMTALREVSLATLSSLDQDQVLETMLDQVGKFIGYASASIKIITPDGWEKMIAGRGPIIHEQIMWDGFDVKENKLVQEMKETRQPVVVQNTQTDERFQRVGNWEAFHSWVGAPLFVRGDLIGHLDVEITSPGFYDEDAVQLLGDFAHTAAIALENAELYDATKRRAEEMSALHRITLLTTSTLDPNEVLELIYERIDHLMKPDTFYIALYDEQQQKLNFEIFAEKGELFDKFSKEAEEMGLSGWIIQSKKPLLIRNIAKDLPPVVPGVVGEEIPPELCYLGVPIPKKDKVIGVISVQSFQPYTYDEEDQHFLAAIADQAAVAIENARLYEETRSRAERMAIVNRIARAASATLHLDELMEAVYREIASIFQGDAFFIALYDEETNELDFRFLVDEGVRGYPGRIPLSGLTSVVVTEKKPLIIREFEQEQDRLPAPFIIGTDKRPSSWLGVPMLIGTRVTGVINVQAYRPHTWGEDDELLLCTIADQVAVAVENARLFEEEQHRTEEMVVLNELGQALTARLSVEEVLVEAYHQASLLVDTTNFYIGLYDEEKDEVSFPFNVSESEIDNQITVMSASQGITGYIIRNRTSVLLGENGLDWQEEKGVETFGQDAPSWLGVPLMIGDRVVGVMVVQSYTTSDLYNEHDRDLLTAIASPTAIALENARLFEAVQQELAERMRTEKALRESEGRFRRLYDSNTLGIVYWDSSDRLVDANDAFLDIIGYTHQDLLAEKLHLQDITPPEYRHLDEKGLEELRKTGACSPFEKEYVRKDGTRVSVLIGGAFLESGGDIGVSYVIDVTGRKQMEKALRESEERFTLAVQGANDGIWDWNIQKHTLYWSPRMKELLGYADGELDVDFDTFETFLHPGDRERTKATMEARLKDGGLYNVDHRLRTKSGEYRWFHARGQALSDEAGNPIRMIGSTSDITDRRQAEEKLHRTLQEVIEALGQTTETRDLYTSSHQKRVTQLSTAIAREMKLSEEQIEGIRVAGLLHDIGKLSIPAEILSKPSQLSEIEYALFKAHPRVAYDILKAIDFPWPVAQIVLQHHERMDGSGYPQGLKGDEILVEPRILAVADVVEAMASHRPYRPSLGVDKALEEIAQNKGKLYDPKVVDVCIRLFDEKGFEFKTQKLISPDSSVSPQ